MTSRPTMLFLDIETSGLNPSVHHILEVGVIAIDDDYQTLGEASILVPVGTSIMMPDMDPFVVAMHTNNGLLEELATAQEDALERRHTLPTWAYRQATTELIAFLTQHAYEFGKVILCGNSIHFDRAFINQRLPAFATTLNYRMRDFSAIEKFLRDDCLVPLPPLPEQSHRGLPDAQNELQTAREIRAIIRQGFGGTMSASRIPPRFR